MKKWQYLILLFVVVLILFACIVSFNNIETIPVELAAIGRGDIINDVVAIGRVEAVREANIHAYESMYINKVLVKEGDVVKAGDMLLDIDMSIRKETLQKAKLKVDQADIRIEEAKRKISVSDKTWYEPSEMYEYLKAKEDMYKKAIIEKEAAQREMNIAKELFHVGAESALNLKKNEDRLKDAEIKLAQAIRELKEADGSYRKKEKTGINLLARKIEYQIALKEKDIAEAEFKIALSELERLRVTSPINGSVTTIKVKDTMHVAKGGNLVTIADLDELQVKSEVDELDATRIKPGQKAIISFQGHSDKKIIGHVKEVAPIAQIVADRTIVYVVISFENQSNLLRISNQVDVKVIIDRRENVLRLPLGALYEGQPPFTYRYKDGTAEKIKIETGLSDMDFIEVINGLNEDDLVIANQNAEIENGVPILPLQN